MSGTARDSQQSQTAPHRNGKILTSEFYLTWLVNFVQYLVMYLLITTMALYAVQQFAASDPAAGFSASAFVVGATLARIFAGYLVDNLGSRPIMLISLLLVVVSCAAYLLEISLVMLFAVRAIHGFGYALVSTATMAIVQSSIPSHRRAEGTGYFALGSTLATALGPAIGLFFVNSFTYGALFWTTLGASSIGFVLGLLVSSRQDEQHAADKQNLKDSRFSFRAIVEPKVMPIACFMAFVGIGYAGIITYLVPYSVDRGVVSGAGLFFVAYACAMLLMRFILGRVQDRRGDNSVMYFGLAAFVLALTLMAIATEDWHVVVAGILTGLGYGTIMPAAQAIAVRLANPLKLGTGISTLLLMMDISVGIGPIGLGYLVTATGYGVMYGVLACMVLLSVALYYFAHGRYRAAKVGVAQQSVVTHSAERH